MLLSSSSDSDGNEDIEAINRILAKSDASPVGLPNELDSDTDSSESDVLGWFRQIQEKFSMVSGDDAPMPKPLCSIGPSSDSDDEDVAATMAAIHKKFEQYQNCEFTVALGVQFLSFIGLLIMKLGVLLG